MFSKSKIPLVIIVACTAGLSDQLLAQSASVEEVLILGVRDSRTSKGATGLKMSLVDTPQSVTVIDSETIDRFGFDEINQVLSLTTGVNVEAVETDRTYYNSRGFDITSMQVDGVGLPFSGGLVQGALDTVIYDRVEVVRGANGLLTGVGNPSGTVNYVRKRPTNELGVYTEATLGSWNKKRLEADLTTPITGSGFWAMRAVAAVEDKESWLNLYENQRNIFYAVIDGQVGDKTTLTFGYSQQDNKSEGVLWGAVPMLYSDGSQTDFDVSSTTSMDWTYWDTHTKAGFAEVVVQLSMDWQFQSTLNYEDYSEPSELFYVYGYPDPDTGLGIYSWPGKYDADAETIIFDNNLTGSFNAWGQVHDLTLGLSTGKRDYGYLDFTALTGFQAMPAYPGWTGSEVERPVFANPYLSYQIETRMDRLYGALHLSATDDLKLILGFNAIKTSDQGFNWEGEVDQKDDKVSPYLGVTWRFTDAANAYVSYSDIYQPQQEINTDLQPLGAAKGKSYEAGFKSEWFNGDLLASLAVFKAEQDNFAEFAGYAGEDFSIATYRGIAIRSEGHELEIAGRLTDSVSLQAGYTQMTLEDPDGNDTRTYIPRKTLKLLATWDVAAIEGLELGTSLRWQDDIYQESAGRINQDAYAIVGLQASYQLTASLEFGINIENLTDEKYLSSLAWDQAFYGSPRALYGHLSWQY